MVIKNNYDKLLNFPQLTKFKCKLKFILFNNVENQKLNNFTKK